MWKKEEIAPKEQFLLFSTIFSVYLYFQESNYIFFVKCGCLIYHFPQFCKSDMSRYGYLTEFLGLRDNECRLYYFVNSVDPDETALKKCHSIFDYCKTLIAKKKKKKKMDVSRIKT